MPELDAHSLLLAVLTPLLLIGLLAAAVPLLRAHQRGTARRAGLRSVEDAAGRADALGPILAHPDEQVRAAAVAALTAGPPEPALTAVAAQPPGPGPVEALDALAALPPTRARALELLRAAVGGDQPELAALAAERWAARDPADAAGRVATETRPEVRLGLGRGLLRADPPAGGLALVALVSDPEADDDLRAEALDDLDALPPPALRAPAAAALEAGRVTPELLWLLAEHGGPEQAAPVAAHLQSPRFETARAALESVKGILARHAQLGPARGPIAAALQAGKDALRAVHPPGDNLLADGLVDGIDGLLQAMG